MKIYARFVGGPCDGKIYEVPSDIKTVTIPGDVRNSGFVKGRHWWGEFVYRPHRLPSGEIVLIPRDLEWVDPSGIA